MAGLELPPGSTSHRDSIVAFDIPRFAFNPGVESIRDDIKEKTRRYRPLQTAGVPFILAVGTGLDPGMNRWESMFRAMYGDEVALVRSDGDQVVAEGGRLNFAGIVTPTPRSAPRHRTLSAAWLIRWQLLDDGLYAEIVHFPNPWAANPVRIMGRDIARVTFSWVKPPHRLQLRQPRQRRLLKVS